MKKNTHFLIKDPNTMTLAEHAKAWHKESGRKMPKNENSKLFKKMYEQWAKYAFKNFGKNQ